MKRTIPIRALFSDIGSALLPNKEELLGWFKQRPVQ